MTTDRYSGAHSQSASASIAAFERAVWNVLAHRPDAGAAIAEAIDLSPDFVAAHALRGFCGVSLARQETLVAAQDAYATAREIFDATSATASERALVDALGLAVSGRLLDAAARLDAHLASAPRDLLALKLSHSLRFMSGDAHGMLATTHRTLTGWTRDTEGYGFVLGCHAFGLEENGLYAEAEAAGRDAVAHEPCDAWGAHAVGHVHEMQNMPEAGIRWLEETRPVWSTCNNFSFHMAWHLALCHLELGHIDVALSIYDTHVRPVPTDDFRDIANAVSLLWRLREENVDVGARWDELAELARKRARDSSLLFASLHHLLTLTATGDVATARSLSAELAARAMSALDDQGRAARGVGLELAQVLGGRSRTAGLAGIAERLAPLGGSRAQRDVFMRALALLAAEAGNETQTRRILALRGRAAPDRFARLAEFTLAAAPAPRQVA